MQVKQESMKITKEREAPFSFIERDKKKKEMMSQVKSEKVFKPFKANRVPDDLNVPKMDPQVERAERERRLKKRQDDLL
jgi:hypothetical protein